MSDIEGNAITLIAAKDIPKAIEEFGVTASKQQVGKALEITDKGVSLPTGESTKFVGIVKAAREAGVYFDETLDFTPVKEDVTPTILKALKSGVRADILKTIKDYGDDLVKNVVVKYADDLTTGVISMLENHWHIQLTMDGDTN